MPDRRYFAEISTFARLRPIWRKVSFFGFAGPMFATVGSGKRVSEFNFPGGADPRGRAIQRDSVTVRQCERC